MTDDRVRRGFFQDNIARARNQLTRVTLFLSVAMLTAVAPSDVEAQSVAFTLASVVAPPGNPSVFRVRWNTTAESPVQSNSR